MLLDTRTGSLTLLLGTNSTRTGTAVAQPPDQLATPAPVATAGAEVGIVPFGAIDGPPGEGPTANGLVLFPFGTDTAAQTFLIGVFGWECIKGDQASVQDSWHASFLASFTCTLATNAKGLAGTRVNASQFYAGTITVLAGNANVSCEAVSPNGDMAGCVRVDAMGAQFVDVRFYRNSSAVSANALYRKV